MIRRLMVGLLRWTADQVEERPRVVIQNFHMGDGCDFMPMALDDLDADEIAQIVDEQFGDCE